MNLMSKKTILFSISLLFLIPSVIGLFIFGLKPNIDFTGGSLIEVQFELPKDQEPTAFNTNQVNQVLAPDYELASVQKSGENQYILRSKTIDHETKQQLLAKLESHFAASDNQEIKEIRFETVGPTLGKELVQKTVSAIILVSLIIILYVWKQFKELKFGVCAVLAMFHDSLLLLGSFSFLGYFFNVEVDVLFVTAVLTNLSFSIHDTIVIYDRIRELANKHRRLKFAQIANLAVLETLVRSINNSLTIILMLLALVVLGGETIRWFSVALLIGAVAGTYSSTFTAVPLLILWEEVSAKFKKMRKN